MRDSFDCENSLWQDRLAADRQIPLERGNFSVAHPLTRFVSTIAVENCYAMAGVLHFVDYSFHLIFPYVDCYVGDYDMIQGQMSSIRCIWTFGPSYEFVNR